MGCSQSKTLDDAEVPYRPQAATGGGPSSPPPPAVVGTTSPPHRQKARASASASSSVASAASSSRGKKGGKRPKKKADERQQPTAVPKTRPRVDTWEVAVSSSSERTRVQTAAAAPPAAEDGASHPPHAAAHRGTVVAQWRTLWETQSPHLVDPADVPACLDQLLSAQVNLLSPVQLTLLLRRIRSAIRGMVPPPAAKGSKMMAAWMGSVGGSSSSPEIAEARTVAERNRLLTGTVLRRIFPANTAAGTVADCRLLLVLGLSEQLWDRVSLAAKESADQAGLEMDVNALQRSSRRWSMPKPSQVPELVEPAALPPGATLSALAGLTGTAVAGTRRQRLQLLFYLLMEPDRLREFLASHPAGGAPVWLLEVDNGAVLSLASLTHYHYYGHAFLPTPVVPPDGLPPFCASKSRQPVAVPANHVVETVRSLLLATATLPGSTNRGKHSSNQSHDSHPSDEGDSSHHSSPVQLFRRDSNSSGAQRRKSAGANDSHAPLEGGEGTESASMPGTGLMTKLREISDGGEADPYYHGPGLDESRLRMESATAEFVSANLRESWTLEDFAAWAAAAVDDLALDAVMHRLFGEGTLPSPATEHELVKREWLEWQGVLKAILGSSLGADESSAETTLEMLTHSIQALMDSSFIGLRNGETTSAEEKELKRRRKMASIVFGGLGGIDGGGGIGHGILYCIDKKWWDSWTAYTGWTFVGDSAPKRSSRRPQSLSTESLLEPESETILRGTLGSYELMKHGLRRGEDYVLVPPGVWDVLYEMYGGGPPLPRMIKSPAAERKFSDANRVSTDDLNGYRDSKEMEDDIEGIGVTNGSGVTRIPDGLNVVCHPWVIRVHLCDPLQPYRRGETGSMSIRVMAAPDQPLWRLFAEIVCRFSLQSYKAFDANGRGKARMWKKIEPTGTKDPVSRYGPWNLICKNRYAILPLMTNVLEIEDGLNELVADWKKYADNDTLESVDLADSDHVMLEFAVENKNGELTWPREAAAKAGRVRRLAEEDKKFRQLLQGVDENGDLLLNPPDLVGLEIDAMDTGGRWYTVKILEVDIDNDETEVEDDEEDNDSKGQPSGSGVSRKKVRVDFGEHGGHIDWIDVESDRLATAGRFASEAEQQATSPSSGNGSGTNGDSKSKTTAVAKRSISSAENGVENAKLCVLPGFGACGLTNLGNTCYMNSAVQCISYLPLLRAYLLSGQYKATGDLNKDNPLGTGGKLLEECAELLRSLWSAKVGEKTPTRFRTQLGKMNPQFSGADQQDAQEFLNYIIDALHEDCNRVRRKPSVEPLDDDWVKKTSLPRVGDEAWRRFLRRNRSIMADVAMGQALNTVTCPVFADVVFQCTVIRRATPYNCPWILNKPRRHDKRSSRYSRKTVSVSGPPSETFVAEQYVIALSRLADSGDLRLQIQNLCGIRANQLRLCRAEVVVNSDDDSESVVSRQIKVSPLSDKDGPASQHAKKRNANDESPRTPTQIIAFQQTLNLRILEDKTRGNGSVDTTSDEEEDFEDKRDGLVPSPTEAAEIERYLDVYGDEQECRFVDTDPLLLAKAVSRSLWPRTEGELKLGLRVDAMDHRGNWFPGSVIEIVDEQMNGGDADTGEEVRIQAKKVRVHFDNFSPKWDEMYSIEHFKKGRVNPLYSHATPKKKPAEFMVHHRYTDRSTGHTVVFGQSFYVQCPNEWSNARAGAHILAQVARFLEQNPDFSGSRQTDSSAVDRDGMPRRLYEKTHTAISDLIDLLVDCDREYVRLALGMSEHNSEEQKASPFRNPSFDATSLSSALVKKVTTLLNRIPFEVRICNVEGAHSDKPLPNTEEVSFPFSLMRTIGNFMNIRHAVFLHWREPAIDKKGGSQRIQFKSPVMYVEPRLQIHESSAELVESASSKKEDGRKNRLGSAGLDLGYCLTEFCKVQKLSIQDNWKCPRCKVIREGGQNMNLWRLPDLLTFHIKRFNMSARWHEKITTKVNFPLTGLDMSEWCHDESPVRQKEPGDSYVYDLIGVMNHYGSMTGGHYVATCKATASSREGREEVAYSFNGVGANAVETEDDSGAPSGWRLGRSRPDTNQNKIVTAMTAKTVTESAEPMWLQFDDEVVEPIPPRLVVSEMAYVLFYRRRHITPSNIAKYSTLE